MNHTEKLKKLISDKKGFIITSDLTEYNIPRQLLKEFVEKGLFEKKDFDTAAHPENR